MCGLYSSEAIFLNKSFFFLIKYQIIFDGFRTKISTRDDATAIFKIILSRRRLCFTAVFTNYRTHNFGLFPVISERLARTIRWRITNKKKKKKIVLLRIFLSPIRLHTIHTRGFSNFMLQRSHFSRNIYIFFFQKKRLKTFRNHIF